MTEGASGSKPERLAAEGQNVSAEQRYELARWIAMRRASPKEVSHGAKLCWDVISRFERHGLECWAGLLRMGHEVGVTESQASRYIDELIKGNYICRVPGRKDKPIYVRLEHPDVEARAQKIYHELLAKAKATSDD